VTDLMHRCDYVKNICMQWWRWNYCLSR